jgi:hypothetical protein
LEARIDKIEKSEKVSILAQSIDHVEADPEKTLKVAELSELQAQRPSKSWNGYVLKKLPMCGAIEESPDAKVYFEWPTITDLKRMVESMPSANADIKTFQISRIESTSYSVLQSLRLTLANGSKSPQIGKYKTFNAEWNAPSGGSFYQFHTVRIRSQRNQFVEGLNLRGEYVDVKIDGSNNSGQW